MSPDPETDLTEERILWELDDVEFEPEPPAIPSDEEIGT